VGGVGRGSTNGLVLFKEIVLLDKPEKDLNIDRFMYLYRFYIHIA